jgi:lysozyme
LRLPKPDPLQWVRLVLFVIATAAPPSCATAAVCAGPSTVQGVNVSSFDGTIDWAAVAGSGKGFAHTRVSDGATFVDPTFDANYAGIKTAGMARGAYQFFEPAQDPTAQAKLLLQKIALPMQPGDLPPALDLEVTGDQPPSTIAAEIQIWMSTVRSSTGRAPIIFTNRFFWDDSVQATTFGDQPLWIVAWGVSCPTLPMGWNEWLFWWYSDTGSVNGIPGQANIDEFNGSQQDLDAAATNDFIFVDGFE